MSKTDRRLVAVAVVAVGVAAVWASLHPGATLGMCLGFAVVVAAVLMIAGD